MPKKIYYAFGYEPISFVNTKAIDLTNDSVDYAATNIDVDGMVPFSISCWNKYDRTFGGGGLFWSTGQFNAYVEGSGAGIRVTIRIYSQNSPSVFIGKRTNGFDAPRAQWNHYCFTYDGSGSDTGINLYVNGSLATMATSSAGTFVTVNPPTGGFQIGNWISGVKMFGLMDEVSVLPLELSAAQVATIYNSGSPISMIAYSPQFYARFEDNLLDEISGNVGVESSGSPVYTTNIPT